MLWVEVYRGVVDRNKIITYLPRLICLFLQFYILVFLDHGCFYNITFILENPLANVFVQK